MSRGYASNKRQRETDRARKKQEKAQRRAEKRDTGPRELEVVSAADAISDLPTVEEAMLDIERRATQNRAASTIPGRLFVGGLGDDTLEADLRAAVGTIGEVIDAMVARDRATRAPRGFGGVTMADRRDATRAIAELDGTELGGRRIAVHLATERGR